MEEVQHNILLVILTVSHSRLIQNLKRIFKNTIFFGRTLAKIIMQELPFPIGKVLKETLFFWAGCPTGSTPIRFPPIAGEVP